MTSVHKLFRSHVLLLQECSSSLSMWSPAGGWQGLTASRPCHGITLSNSAMTGLTCVSVPSSKSETRTRKIHQKKKKTEGWQEVRERVLVLHFNYFKLHHTLRVLSLQTDFKKGWIHPRVRPVLKAFNDTISEQDVRVNYESCTDKNEKKKKHIQKGRKNTSLLRLAAQSKLWKLWPSVSFLLFMFVTVFRPVFKPE